MVLGTEIHTVDSKALPLTNVGSHWDNRDNPLQLKKRLVSITFAFPSLRKEARFLTQAGLSRTLLTILRGESIHLPAGPRPS